MSTIHQSPNCGTNRVYVFRPMKTKTFSFKVKTNANANICLSPAPSETPYSQFEIFLGGWGGGESALRRNKKDDVHKVKTPNILNKNAFMGFWVVVGHHEIKVGKEGEAMPFLTHSDPSVRIDLSYYGYCTSYGSTGQWIFPDDNYGPGIDLGSIADAIDGIIYPSGHGGFQPPPPGLFPPGPPAPPPPYYPPEQPSVAGGGIAWFKCTSLHTCPSAVPVNPGHPNCPYVAAAYHNGGLIPGCVTPPQVNVCHVPWGGQANAKMDFFMLSNSGNVELVWQAAARGSVPVGALQGGYAENGEKLYVGRFRQGGSYIGGKVHPSHHVCYAPFRGRETSSHSYEVLCLKTVPLSLLGL